MWCTVGYPINSWYTQCLHPSQAKTREGICVGYNRDTLKCFKPKFTENFLRFLVRVQGFEFEHHKAAKITKQKTILTGLRKI